MPSRPAVASSCAPICSLALAVALLGGCSRSNHASPILPPVPEARAPLSRAEFNRIAVRLDLPVFWRDDANADGVADLSELAALLFYPSSDHPDLVRAREAVLAAAAAASLPGLSPEAAARRRLVEQDLDQGAPTVVATDLRGATPDDKKLYAHALEIARAIDDLYATTRGAKALAPRVPIDDALSQSLFRRDWGPACVAAKTRDNPACSAIPGAPHPTSDAYPPALQEDAGFCAKLEQLPQAAALQDPFSVVRYRGGALASVPYPEAYPAQMRAIATALRAAAADENDPQEGPLRDYLQAAAQSFTTNDWAPADEAWSRMNVRNSRWYLRVAPDEVYRDPCSLKAQFHFTFARIDRGSLTWQDRLAPVEADMEKALATLLGPPYAPRAVAFHLPDFIDVVFNAGDDREPLGATAGESLPNWGKVATEGRGRTVAMVNLGQDRDTLATRRAQAASLVDAASMAPWSDDPEGALLGTILHEATHNLGPTSATLVGGQKPSALFGGPLASMLEELKAETGAMFYLDWLRARGLVAPELVGRAYVAWMAWAMRHISVGVHSGTGDEAYSQLAAIQLGFAMDDGAISFSPKAPAANGADLGAFTLRYAALPATFAKLMKLVGTLKATGDRAGAEALVAKYVDGPVVPFAAITERELRFPETTVVYSVDL